MLPPSFPHPYLPRLPSRRSPEEDATQQLKKQASKNHKTQQRYPTPGNQHIFHNCNYVGSERKAATKIERSREEGKRHTESNRRDRTLELLLLLDLAGGLASFRGLLLRELLVALALLGGLRLEEVSWYVA
jgi:hypothetical protein